jgi:hypothetical protein
MENQLIKELREKISHCKDRDEIESLIKQLLIEYEKLEATD